LGRWKGASLGRSRALHEADAGTIDPVVSATFTGHAANTERKQDFASAQQTFELLKQVYVECGYELIELRKLSVAERADFILDHL
jgi:predicted ATPase